MHKLSFKLLQHSWLLVPIVDSPVSVTMRIRHYFSENNSSIEKNSEHPLPATAEKKFSTLPKQTKEKTSQTSPKKPVRTFNKKNPEDKKLFKSNSGSKLLSSQSLRISSSVPSLGQAKRQEDTEGKVRKKAKKSCFCDIQNIRMYFPF